MARLRCPACDAELDLDARHLGEEVECGNCLKVFVAPRPRTPPRARVAPPPDPDDGDAPVSFAPEAPGAGTAAVLSLVFGILSLPLSCCWCAGLPAGTLGIICGIIGLQTPQSKGLATTGLALSVVGLLLGGGVMLFGFANGNFVIPQP